ncbi:hypothetical protein [Haloarchaeobius sp. TZWSO28]|uniref:hypothetical protein n=1 Tax=Haloarchaeobius sp. TZWSO28 TaxID=3446119 RepID=UPI003EC0DD20
MRSNDFEYIDESEVKSEYIPGGSLLDFAPGGGYIPGKEIENGKYIGLVRTWGEDRRVDRKLRIVNNEFEEKMDYYFEGELFFSEEWNQGVATWNDGIISLPEGFTHTLKSYINLLIFNWSYDDINELWWEKYEENF